VGNAYDAKHYINKTSYATGKVMSLH